MFFFAFQTILSIIFFNETGYFLVYSVSWDLGLGCPLSLVGILSQVGPNHPIYKANLVSINFTKNLGFGQYLVLCSSFPQVQSSESGSLVLKKPSLYMPNQQKFKPVQMSDNRLANICTSQLVQIIAEPLANIYTRQLIFTLVDYPYQLQHIYTLYSTNILLLPYFAPGNPNLSPPQMYQFAVSMFHIYKRLWQRNDK